MQYFSGIRAKLGKSGENSCIFAGFIQVLAGVNENHVILQHFGMHAWTTLLKYILKSTFEAYV